MSTRDGASLANWLTPAHIGWSVRHAREIVPTATGYSSDAPRLLPERLDDSLLDVMIEAQDGAIPLRRLLGERQRDALLVLKDADVVLEWTAPDVRTDEQHLMFSVAKSVTGTLACALASDGLGSTVTSGTGN